MRLYVKQFKKHLSADAKRKRRRRFTELVLNKLGEWFWVWVWGRWFVWNEKMGGLLVLLMLLGLYVGLNHNIPKPEWSSTGFGSFVQMVFLLFVAPSSVVKVVGWVFGVYPGHIPPKVDYPSNWEELRGQARARDDYECGNCHATTFLHVHHIVPLSKGGTNNLSNLRALCEDCHKCLHPHML